MLSWYWWQKRTRQIQPLVSFMRLLNDSISNAFSTFIICLCAYSPVSLLRKEFGWSCTGCQFLLSSGGMPAGMWFPIGLFYFKHSIQIQQPSPRLHAPTRHLMAMRQCPSFAALTISRVINGMIRVYKSILKYFQMTDRQKLVHDYAQKKIQHDKNEEQIREKRFELRDKRKQVTKTDNQLKSLQSVGQIIGEVLKEITKEKYIVKSSSGTRNVVGVKVKLDRAKLVVGARVALDQTTQTIMQVLPREVDPLVFNMMNEDPGKVDFSDIGGLGDQLRILRETIELPITNPQLFKRVGIKPPKGCLMYGPPGTGKTLIARALASNIQAKFLKVVASAIVDKYIGESARVIREMFAFAKQNQPCIIFMDEIDAIGGRRFSEGSSADREVQRTLMELLNQLDGFDQLGRVKVVMATNRPDILDPALLRPGRLDRKVQIPLPNEAARVEILKIHAKGITMKGDIDFQALAKICEEFNGADLRNVCTEGGMFAIREDREYVVEEDLMKAARKIRENKKLESKLDYSKV